MKPLFTAAADLPDMLDGKAPLFLSVFGFVFLLPTTSSAIFIFNNLNEDQNMQGVGQLTRSQQDSPPQCEAIKGLLVPQATVPPYPQSSLTTAECSHRENSLRGRLILTVCTGLQIILLNTGVFHPPRAGPFKCEFREISFVKIEEDGILEAICMGLDNHLRIKERLSDENIVFTVSMGTE